MKNLTTAEGGALTWRNREGLDNEKLYRELQLLSLHGQNKDALAKAGLGSWEYDIVGPYYKCNMTDIMAALGLAQLKRYPEILKRRRQIIEMYNEELKDLPITALAHYKETYESSGHGEPKCLFLCLDRRSEDGLKVDFYDLDWHPMPFERHYPRSNRTLQKPTCLNEMLELSKTLSKGIPFVRVDFYIVNDQIKFGELTFFPGSGMEEFTPESYDYLLGSWIDLSLVEGNQKEDANVWKKK